MYGRAHQQGISWLERIHDIHDNHDQISLRKNYLSHVNSLYCILAAYCKITIRDLWEIYFYSAIMYITHMKFKIAAIVQYCNTYKSCFQLINWQFHFKIFSLVLHDVWSFQRISDLRCNKKYLIIFNYIFFMWLLCES